MCKARSANAKHVRTGCRPSQPKRLSGYGWFTRVWFTLHALVAITRHAEDVFPTSASCFPPLLKSMQRTMIARYPTPAQNNPVKLTRLGVLAATGELATTLLRSLLLTADSCKQSNALCTANTPARRATWQGCTLMRTLGGNALHPGRASPFGGDDRSPGDGACFSARPRAGQRSEFLGLAVLAALGLGQQHRVDVG